MKATAAFWNFPRVLADASEAGLTTAKADERLRQDGPNDATAVHRRPACLRFIGRFRNPLVLILLAASGLSALTGDVASFVIILTIVVASVLLDFVQETRAQDTVDALQQKVSLHADVLRDGAMVKLDFARVVRGDVVTLSAGDLVPADGRLLASRDLLIDQALLTGESFPVEKSAADLTAPVAEIADAANAALAGTSVVSGSATLLVMRTGRATALGRLAGSLVDRPPPNAFETGLARFSTLILRITVVLVLVVLTSCRRSATGV